MANTRGNQALAAFPSEIREVTSKELHAAPTKALANISAASGEVIALTRYHETFAYVVSADLTKELVSKSSAMDSLVQDIRAVEPYLKAALVAGVSPIDALNEILKDDSDGNFGVDFAGLARLMSRTPMRLVSNEDGSPITRVNFDGIRGVGTGNDDYSLFDDK
jgi:hypothetical protein